MSLYHEHHLHRLDGLRGLAALQVFIYHLIKQPDFVYWIEGDNAEWIGHLQVLLRGPNAVYLFFVLSGFVLGLSLDRETFTWRSGGSFYLRRALRLYPAYFLAFLFAIFLAGVGDWCVASFGELAQGWTQNGINRDQVIHSLFLLNVNYNPPAWSIQIEFLASLLFPLAYLCRLKFSLVMNMIVLLTLMMAGHMLGGAFIYGYMFFGGLFISQLDRESENKQSINLLFGNSGLLFLGLLLFFSSYFINAFGLNHLICSVGAWLVIVQVAFNKNNPILQYLDWRPVSFLGKISYSFYLNHWLGLLAIYLLMRITLSQDWMMQWPGLSLLTLGVASFLITLLLAWLSWMVVEKPSLKLKHYLRW